MWKVVGVTSPSTHGDDKTQAVRICSIAYLGKWHRSALPEHWRCLPWPGTVAAHTSLSEAGNSFFFQQFPCGKTSRITALAAISTPVPTCAALSFALAWGHLPPKCHATETINRPRALNVVLLIIPYPP